MKLVNDTSRSSTERARAYLNRRTPRRAAQHSARRLNVAHALYTVRSVGMQTRPRAVCKLGYARPFHTNS
eukprot:12259265-Alexandrium_andersonii.AAC.1